jgi:putative FmdB family regulatory protein
MPIYEYRCQSCGHEFEEFQSISLKAEKTVCPSCKGHKTKRLVSQTSFALKGSGWYVTDYSGKKPASTESAESSTATDTRPKDDAKPKEKSCCCSPTKAKETEKKTSNDKKSS